MALGARALILVIVLAVLLGATGGAVTSALLASSTVGASGQDGEPGADGANGTDGAAGADGAAGRDGVDGAPGARGPAGERGAVGPLGETGPSGAAGPAGANGATGAQGEQGIPGNTGPQGPQGDPGPAGAAGPQGVSATNDWMYSSLSEDSTSGGNVALQSTATAGDLGVTVVDGIFHVIPADGLYRVSTAVRVLNNSDTALFYLRLNALRFGTSGSVANVPEFSRLSERQIGGLDLRDLDAATVAYLEAGDRVYAEVFRLPSGDYLVEGAWLLIEHLEVVE